MRRSLELESRRPGDIVFDTGDTATQADARDQAAFDREELRGRSMSAIPAR